MRQNLRNRARNLRSPYFCKAVSKTASLTVVLSTTVQVGFLRDRTHNLYSNCPLATFQQPHHIYEQHPNNTRVGQHLTTLRIQNNPLATLELNPNVRPSSKKRPAFPFGTASVWHQGKVVWIPLFVVSVPLLIPRARVFDSPL